MTYDGGGIPQLSFVSSYFPSLFPSLLPDGRLADGLGAVLYFDSKKNKEYIQK